MRKLLKRVPSVCSYLLGAGLIFFFSCRPAPRPLDEAGLFEYVEPLNGVGAIITFTSNRAGNLDIYAMDTSGTAVNPLIEHPQPDYGGRWFPVGLRFRSARDTARKAAFYIMSWPDKQITPWRLGAGGVRPDASPDGRFMAYPKEIDGQVDLFVTNRHTRATYRVTDDTQIELVQDWAPSGRFVLYKAFEKDDPYFPQYSSELYAYDCLTGKRFQLTDNRIWDGEARWSPDGTSIVYTVLVDSVADLRLLTDTAKAPLQIASSPAIDRNPAWSPDGRYLLFESNRSGNFEIYRYRISDGTLDRLTHHPARDLAPAWQPLFRRQLAIKG